MTPILICMIVGLAISIERIITLNLATTNTKKLLGQIEDALSKGGVNAALDITRNTRGPVASIFTQGLMRHHEGIDMVEKSIVSYGGVEMGKLERGLIWISLDDFSWSHARILWNCCRDGFCVRYDRKSW